MTKRRIVLSGYYGFNNAGDEAVLSALVQLIRENIADTDIVALSADPAATAERLGIRAVNRWDKAAVKRELGGAALFCSGGGSLLQDVTSVRSVYYYAAQIRLAQKLNVPTMVLAQGLGPLNTRMGRWLAAGALKHCRLLSWRDEKSARLAADLGLGDLPNYTVCDPVLLWRPEVADGGERGAVVLALRPWNNLDIDAAVALVSNLRAVGERVVLLPLYYGKGAQLGEDERLAAEINRRLGDKPAEVAAVHSPEEVAAVIGGAKLVVGMRLHALIMAAAAGVPAVAISYDPKVSAFAESMGIAEIGGGVQFKADEATGQILAALSERADYPTEQARECWRPLLEEMRRLLG